MKQYRLNGVGWVHDGRGCFIRDGEIAFLNEERAQRIIDSAARKGNLDALIEVSEPDPSPSEQPAEQEPEVQAQPEVPSEMDGSGVSFSVFDIAPVLSLHATKRKRIASSLTGKKVTSSAKADEVIKSWDVVELEKAFLKLTEG